MFCFEVELRTTNVKGEFKQLAFHILGSCHAIDSRSECVYKSCMIK